MEPEDAQARQQLANRAVLAMASSTAIDSPCISVCTMNFDGSFCLGCMRTLDEISVWSRCDNAQKKAIWAHIAKRLADPSGDHP